MLGGMERRQTVCLSPSIYNERECDARQLQAITTTRPTVLAPDCLCDLYFVILTTFRCVSAFFPVLVFAFAELCLNPFVGVVECASVGVELQMSILISWLEGLTDC